MKTKNFESDKIDLQQDGRNKICVSLEKSIIIYNLKVYFKWRKNITLERMYRLGSFEYNNFIEHLSKLQ